MRRCLELIPLEEVADIRTQLAGALLNQFAYEGIEPVRDLVQRRAYASEFSDLMRRLVTVSTIMVRAQKLSVL